MKKKMGQQFSGTRNDEQWYAAFMSLTAVTVLFLYTVSTFTFPGLVSTLYTGIVSIIAKHGLVSTPLLSYQLTKCNETKFDLISAHFWPIGRIMK